MALPGVRILPGEELYAEYGKDYWLDHMPDLPAAIRTMCIQKYKYRHSELTKAGLNPDGSRPTSAPSILPFLRLSHPTLARPSLFLHEETVVAKAIAFGYTCLNRLSQTSTTTRTCP